MEFYTTFDYYKQGANINVGLMGGIPENPRSALIQSTRFEKTKRLFHCHVRFILFGVGHPCLKISTHHDRLVFYRLLFNLLFMFIFVTEFRRLLRSVSSRIQHARPNRLGPLYRFTFRLGLRPLVVLDEISLDATLLLRSTTTNPSTKPTQG